jgi:hypothetical protein
VDDSFREADVKEAAERRMDSRLADRAVAALDWVVA